MWKNIQLTYKTIFFGSCPFSLSGDEAVTCEWPVWNDSRSGFSSADEYSGAHAEPSGMVWLCVPAAWRPLLAVFCYHSRLAGEERCRLQTPERQEHNEHRKNTAETELS